MKDRAGMQAGRMEEEINGFLLQPEERPAGWSSAVPLERRKHARSAVGIVIRNEHEERSIDRVDRRIEQRSPQHHAAELELEVVRQIAVRAASALQSVSITEAPVREEMVFGDQLAHAHRRPFHGLIGVSPAFRSIRREMNVCAVRISGEEWDL